MLLYFKGYLFCTFFEHGLAAKVITLFRNKMRIDIINKLAVSTATNGFYVFHTLPLLYVAPFTQMNATVTFF